MGTWNIKKVILAVKYQVISCLFYNLGNKSTFFKTFGKKSSYRSSESMIRN